MSKIGAGFVHAAGGRIVDGQGRDALRRGIGLGNWLLPEGYMWKLPDGASSPRQIEALFAELAGADYASQFWGQYYDTFITSEDVRLIAEAGFDHVRLPINSRIVMNDNGELIEEGCGLIDRLIGWCERQDLGVLLDLHGAPGGQTGTNIDDSPNGKPELFMDEGYRAQTIALWQAIATRYAANQAVVGYDLLNEPLPNEWQDTFPNELVQLYRDLTRQIRELDPHHLLMYEGTHWATNWDIFTEVWDDNAALQFHRYWCPPDQTSIQAYLDLRDQLGLPIYMGEGGENNPAWIFTATRLYERHGIGWNYWPWKKLDTLTSPLSATAPDGWHDLVNYASGAGPRPSVDQTQRILDDLLDAFKAENCVSRTAVTNALFGRPPLVVPGWGFETVSPPVYDTSSTVMRPDEGAIIVAVDRHDGKASPNWHHTDGRPRSAAEELLLDLRPGQSATFSLPLASGCDVKVATADDCPADATWNGDSLVVSSERGARLLSLEIGAT